MILVLFGGKTEGKRSGRKHTCPAYALEIDKTSVSYLAKLLPLTATDWLAKQSKDSLKIPISCAFSTEDLVPRCRILLSAQNMAFMKGFCQQR